MNQYIKNGIIGGIIIFVVSYGGLLASIRLFPDYFIDYISPVFNSDGTRNVYFYLHPFVLSFALAIFWIRFNQMFHTNLIIRGIVFGLIYTCIALIPVMWITYSAVDVSLSMVFTWLLYGFIQSCVAGIVFSKLEPKI